MLAPTECGDAPVDLADQDLRAAAPIQLARERPFRLGAVDVRPATREVVGRHGREVLEPRVMQVLVALARAGGEIVTRDDLIASCWDGRIVGEDAINRVISRLRRHSEGVGRDGWSLETVTKVGYRLVPAGERGELAPAPPAAADSRRRALVLSGGALGVLALAGGGLAWSLRPRISAKAQTLYDKGREALRQGQAEPTAQAVGFLREAVAEQPDFAPAWGALAQAYQKSLTFTDPARQAGVHAQAEAAARRAMTLDPDQPEAAAALAMLTPIYRNWAEAETRFLRALALHPREPAVCVGYCKLMLSVGRIKAALGASETALAADPYSPYHHSSLGLALWSLGRTEEAERVARKALTLWPRHLAIWFLLFHILAYGGRGDEAMALAAQVDGRPLSVPPEDIELSLTGVRALLTRAPAEVEIAVRAHLAAAARGVGFAENAMQWMSALGQLDAAFVVARGLFFDEGFRLGSQRYSAGQGRFMRAQARNTYQLFMPATAALRADPRFPGLAAELGLAAYWRGPGRAPDDPAWARTA
ncbi:winged helix-turn-helix domain-containing protein [Phenylobacterium sp.]|uniref:winged helix-turn-helix domain-containing protein n=1 Tax=Phenylobacterium sp. TaxID=1871053 RepID=UPI00286CAC69|nr:winged helix-turn-helix domain-containing protein [Phenylobacterium sp.]